MDDVIVLDACCGSRMFWFDRTDERAVFADIRSERHSLPDKSSKGGFRELVISPDVQCDFTDMPFENGQFALVVFDPPHLVNAGPKSWLAKKYGKLGERWQDDLRAGFAECFRVLKEEGVLIFKWSECQVPLSKILPLIEHKPLFGNRGGRANKSHWLVFIKPAQAMLEAAQK